MDFKSKRKGERAKEREREGGREAEKERERDQFVLLLIYASLVDSCSCRDPGSNPRPWLTELELLFLFVF